MVMASSVTKSPMNPSEVSV
uniref:Uncharacterized protein n=1 Tax=Anopheles albimanus TaxID=7167 RepID=A0A182FGH1_ANOAL